MNIFHVHKKYYDLTKFVIEYQHPLDSGKISRCPYKDCTKKYRVFYCECGKEMNRENYKW